MIEEFHAVCHALLKPRRRAGRLPIIDPVVQLDPRPADSADACRRMNAAFLILLAGRRHPAFKRARNALDQAAAGSSEADIARFYLGAEEFIRREIETVGRRDQDFATQLKQLSAWLENTPDAGSCPDINTRIWAVFFPEAVGLQPVSRQAVAALRAKRRVAITGLNPRPVRDPIREILFSANVLLTLPADAGAWQQLSLSRRLKEKLQRVARQPQRYWYDHPIHIGTPPEKNEMLYGLRGLDAALAFEQAYGHIPSGAPLTCLLSVSVTHPGLRDIARTYLESELSRAGGLKNIHVVLFTEADTQHIIEAVLAPAARHYLGRSGGGEDLAVFGVDGEYGRHYSFLKAVAAFWKVFIRPQVQGTFKIDLDQVFDQDVLVAQTGLSAFEHFMTPLWGARGLDVLGRPVELGMMAGALVNEKDIQQSLFTPDVRFAERGLRPEEWIFCSALPQAVSTAAEMMTRYDSAQLDGHKTCIERFHVTGGTNGILIESLRRQRPFTPSFIGRAEDQAYLLAAFANPAPRLAYLHKDGLIMRHDKEAFAGEAIRAAEIGRTLGDYVRILYFSAYAGMLSENAPELKSRLDPFTGCFISRIPATVVFLRFALYAADLFRANQSVKARELVRSGCRRIASALEFTEGQDSALKRRYRKERYGWNLYYDTLAAMEAALGRRDPFAMSLRRKARALIRRCAPGNQDPTGSP